jgi:glycosyltransferase involved in cell wall biosynthesis
VSVIVPVYNSAAFIRKLLDGLEKQDYPQDRREIIIVDNGSNDDTAKIISEYPFILAQENDIQSSYAARNKGISIAKGEIIAFTDADCRPRPDWLSNGVRSLLESGADMVAGKVEFIYSEKPTAAEIYDSITHMQMESQVRERGVAPTANIFVKRDMFDKIGLFDSRVKSGGDAQWTGKATKKGFRLDYCGLAVVAHPTRNFREIIKKVIRTGAGSPHARLAAGHSVLHEFFYTPYSVFFKIKIDKINLRENFRQKGLDSNISFNRILMVALAAHFVSRLSALVEFWRILLLMAVKKYKVGSNV